jgi:hypothetical protein
MPRDRKANGDCKDGCPLNGHRIAPLRHAMDLLNAPALPDCNCSCSNLVLPSWFHADSCPRHLPF